VASTEGKFMATCRRGHDLTDDNLYIKPDGRRTCKKCTNKNQRDYKRSLEGGRKYLARVLKRAFWSLELFDAVSLAQDGRCAICGRLPFPQSRLSADHDHESSKPRGLLCAACNSALGLFRDNPALLDKAAAYLRKYGR